MLKATRCKHCGRTPQECGVPSFGYVSYWVCEDCRSKMNKASVTLVLYEDGHRGIMLDCDFCKCAPCQHTDFPVSTDPQSVALEDLKLVLREVKFNVEDEDTPFARMVIARLEELVENAQKFKTPDTFRLRGDEAKHFK